MITIRTQEEITARCKEALARERTGRCGEGELAVLSRALTLDQIEDPYSTRSDIYDCVAGLMKIWKRAVEENRESDSQDCLARMRGYKWLLGHIDADVFPGSLNSPSSAGPWTRDAFAIVAHQIDVGNFDFQTKRADEAWEQSQTKKVTEARVGLPPAEEGAWRTEYVANLRGFECRVLPKPILGKSEDGKDSVQTPQGVRYDVYFSGRYVGQYDTIEEAFFACENELGAASRVAVIMSAEEAAVELHE